MKLSENNLHVLIEKEEDLYSAICLELDVPRDVDGRYIFRKNSIKKTIT